MSANGIQNKAPASPADVIGELLADAERHRCAGRLDEAERSYHQALALRPDFPEAHNNLGSVYLQLGRLNEAETSFRSALALRPDFPEAHYNLAVSLKRSVRLQDAVRSFRQALAYRPDLAEAHNDLGSVYRLLGHLEEAESSFRQAVASRPGYAEAHHNLATVLVSGGRLQEAEQSLRTALALRPDLPAAHGNLGMVLAGLGRLEEAEQSYLRALTLDQNDRTAAYNLSLLRLLRGDFDTGFELFESRFEGGSAAQFGACRKFLEQLRGLPRWNGEPVQGKGLLIWSEQGLGDTLMMMRYLPRLKERGASRIVMICPVELARLVRALPGVDQVVSSGTVSFEGFAYHCSIMSLPFLFHTRLDTIPREVPYLHVPEDLCRRWADRLADVMRPRIGLAWAGSAENPKDRIRSIPLRQFATLLRLNNLSLVSLQKGEAASEIEGAAARILDWMPACEDLLETAALIEQLDLVISVDTAVAHLAGALGKPVWLLNRLESEWRWMLDCDDSPWYPTMRMFRQTRKDDWDEVLSRVAAALDTRRYLG